MGLLGVGVGVLRHGEDIGTHVTLDSGLVVAKVIFRNLFKISTYCVFSEYTSVNSIICSAKSLAITLLCIMLKNFGNH